MQGLHRKERYCNAIFLVYIYIYIYVCILIVDRAIDSHRINIHV